MIRHLFILGTFAFIFLAGNSSYAGFSSIDYGSCGKFVQDYDYFHQNLLGKPLYGGENVQKYAEYYKTKGYIEGFISGSSSRVGRTITRSDSAGWLLYIYNYCKEHPLENLVNAITKLDIELDNEK